ncbi:MAG: universal stress protein [bacterium]|nr:universal stress protein [bacterium]
MIERQDIEPSEGLQGFDYQAALQDFRRARRQASLEQMFAFLKGRSNDLLSYEDVRKKLKVTGMSAGKLEEIPLNAIVGSVGRYKDFTRSFLPRSDSDQGRWAKVKSIATGMEGLPPIEVYQIDEVYFVLDGNHRVSVARQLGAEYIEAYVVKIKTKVPISPDIQPDELQQKAEYADFLDKTHLDALRPGADLTMSLAGRYRLLEEQIEEHRYFLGTEQQREIPYNEALMNWYDRIYLPVVGVIKKHDILEDFPAQTLTDLYLWISEYRAAIREGNVQYFEEHMTEILEKLPLVPDIELDTLILDAEYIDFLEYTQIEKIRPKADLRVTAPGKYAILEKHIEVHRHFLGENAQREIPVEEAVSRWYDNVYMPVAITIRRLGMLKDFPHRTEADLYLWISEYQQKLERRLGWEILPEKAAGDLANSFSKTPERVFSRVGGKVYDAMMPDEFESGPPPGVWRKEDLGRHNERLFDSILVPVSGRERSWIALDQALMFARLRGQHVYGLHVIPSGDEAAHVNALKVQAEFAARCREQGVNGTLTIQEGEIDRKVCELSRWADLVIINVVHPPGTNPLAKFKSGLRTILWRCSRPVLAVPKFCSEIRRIVLAYDASRKADEALFIGAYMGSSWSIPLLVVTVEEIGRTSPSVMNLAKDYLKRRHVEADYVTASGNVSEMILTVAENYECDLIIMGGYGRGPMLEMVLGSTVNRILQKSHIPVLICR